ncbi:accessory Sec system glycosyltransferase Asp1, partial [Pseudomonas aeruginosa]
ANYLMDDRGLVSSVIYYEDGQAIYQDYLNPKGLWQFREHLQDDGRIEVNPIFAFRFQQEAYQDMGELIAEFFEKKIAQHPEEGATYFLPACDQHNSF